MLNHDGRPLRVLDVGGTGTIRASRARLSLGSGTRVPLLSRGTDPAGRDLAEGVAGLTGAPCPAGGAW